MTREPPILWWVRRDLRLIDNPVAASVSQSGRPVVPVFILDEVFEGYGACPLWRFGLGVKAFRTSLQSIGSDLILRRGRALDVLRDLARETGATEVRWSRAYDPDQVERDTGVKTGLVADGIDAESVATHLLFEPWDVKTGQGGFYQVYSPYWKAVKDRTVQGPQRAPDRLPAPSHWPLSEALEEWGLERVMNRGASVVGRYLSVGEDKAQAKLADFVEGPIRDYRKLRDFPALPATSGLSENLAWGEISVRQCWHAGQRALQDGKAGAETFLKELVWREFAYHLVWHTPHITTGNWREKWDAFPWNRDGNRPVVLAWKQGQTGIRFVDAAMRQLYATGHMHNRARMIVASFLTKHLMTDWRIGLDWFADCLADWDPASNAMGWQWAAGSGPDAAPYFRVFNPDTQLQKFDKDGAYATNWIAEGSLMPADDAQRFFEAVPRHWGLAPSHAYPGPIIELAEGRARALEAYQNRVF